MDAIVRDKQAYHEQTARRMDEHFVLPEWSVRQKLALSCRILAAEGHDSGLAGLAGATWPVSLFLVVLGIVTFAAVLSMRETAGAALM